MKKLLIALLLAAVCAGGIYAGLRYRKEVVLPVQKTEADAAHLAEQLEPIRPAVTVGGMQKHTADNVNLLDKAQSASEDIKAWITIPDTRIDFPVVQSEDNEFYLDHSVDKTENALGVPFLDCRCLPDFSGFTSIVYGHNVEGMRMFADVASYSRQAFLEQHDTGWLITEHAVQPVHFFGYLTVRSDSPVYHTNFLTESEKADYIDMIFSDAVYTTQQYQPDELKDQRFLLLSTCTFEYEEARGVLIGVIEPAGP